MPTGVHLPDARQRLFDAAEALLLRDGATALTSRAVTEEAGVAKGVLHRHFSDFDDFLVALVLDRGAGLQAQSAELADADAVGDGSVADNLTTALTSLFGPVPVAIIPLITFRDELRRRLRVALPGGGIAILSQASTAISDYLSAERARGRIAADADIGSLTLSLVGGGHLLHADREPGPPSRETVQRFVESVVAEPVRRAG